MCCGDLNQKEAQKERDICILRLIHFSVQQKLTWHCKATINFLKNISLEKAQFISLILCHRWNDISKHLLVNGIRHLRKVLFLQCLYKTNQSSRWDVFPLFCRLKCLHFKKIEVTYPKTCGSLVKTFEAFVHLISTSTLFLLCHMEFWQKGAGRHRDLLSIWSSRPWSHIPWLLQFVGSAPRMSDLLLTELPWWLRQ